MEATNQLNLALDDYRGRHKELRYDGFFIENTNFSGIISTNFGVQGMNRVKFWVKVGVRFRVSVRIWLRIRI